MVFSAERIREIYQAAVAVRADPELLLGGMPPGFTARLARLRAAGDRLHSDLSAMNEVGELGDGSVPLRVWLINAATLYEIRKEARVFEAALRELKEPKAWLDAPRFPFHEAAPQRLYKVLVEAVRELHRARALAEQVPISLELWTSDRGIGPAWRSLLELAAAQGKLRALVEVVLADGEVRAFHPGLRAVVEGAEGQSA